MSIILTIILQLLRDHLGESARPKLAERTKCEAVQVLVQSAISSELGYRANGLHMNLRTPPRVIHVIPAITSVRFATGGGGPMTVYKSRP